MGSAHDGAQIVSIGFLCNKVLIMIHMKCARMWMEMPWLQSLSNATKAGTSIYNNIGSQCHDIFLRSVHDYEEVHTRQTTVDIICTHMH